jgi:hypothetical protein
MANVKISALPQYTGSTREGWTIFNNSGETTTYKTKVENLGDNLGWDVNKSTITFDASASSYLSTVSTTAGDLGYAISAATNDFVIELKAANLWNSIRVMYPYLGNSGTPTTINLKTPASYAMSWNGTLVYTNGVSANGGYGDTSYNPFSNMTFPSLQLGTYIMGFSYSSEQYPTDIGVIGTSRALINWWGNDNYSRADFFTDGGSERIGEPNTSTGGALGVVIANRNTTSNFNTWLNGVKWAQNSSVMDSSSQLPDGNVSIFRFNGGNQANRKHGIDWVADGMDDASVQLLSSIIIKYMSSIGRAVN